MKRLKAVLMLALTSLLPAVQLRHRPRRGGNGCRCSGPRNPESLCTRGGGPRG